MTENYFRMSVLSAVLELQEQQLAPETFAEMVRRGATIGHRSFDYATAQYLDTLTGCISRSYGTSRQERLCGLINHLVCTLQPAWAHSIPFGRQVVLDLIPDDARQCLRVAKLLETPAGPECRSWWEKLAAEFRRRRDDRLLEIGREGEQLTLQLETERLRGTGFTPEWVALEDNTAGYDVRSRDVSNEAERPIEVKATTTTSPQFHITANEWRVASIHKEQWRLHLWVLPQAYLYEYTHTEVAPHIPHDQGMGRWQEVIIRMPSGDG